VTTREAGRIGRIAVFARANVSIPQKMRTRPARRSAIPVFSRSDTAEGDWTSLIL
jgi:hypothetical protein